MSQLSLSVMCLTTAVDPVRSLGKKVERGEVSFTVAYSGCILCCVFPKQTAARFKRAPVLVRYSWFRKWQPVSFTLRTQVATLANQNKTQTIQKTKQNFKQIRIENMYKEYVYERVGFAFTSGWWTRWREFFQPMPERSKT